METMKKYLVIIAMALALCLSGCATKGSAISDLRNLRNDIVDYGYRYDVDDWRNAATRYQKIDEKLKKYANDYTYDESREIGRLKGECVAGFAKGVSQNAGDKVGNLRGFIEGIVDGFGDAFKKDK